MRFFLNPFIFVFELIGFLISAVFVYGLALIATIAFIAYAITTLEPRYDIINIVEKHEITKFVEKGPELVCIKLAGCKIVHDAKTEEEYCPSCIMK